MEAQKLKKSICFAVRKVADVAPCDLARMSEELLSRFAQSTQNEEYISSITRSGAVNTSERLSALLLLADMIDLMGDTPSRLVLARADGGKPYFSGEGRMPAFSLSHSDGYVACAVALDGDGLGVDIEGGGRIDELRCKKIADRYFFEGELEDYKKYAKEKCSPSDIFTEREAFLKIWTAKEALCKLGGDGGPYRVDSTSLPSGVAITSYALEGDGEPSAIASLCAPTCADVCFLPVKGCLSLRRL